MSFYRHGSSYWDEYITPRPSYYYARPAPIESSYSYSYRYRSRSSSSARPMIRDRDDDLHRLRAKCDDLYEEARKAYRRGEDDRAERKLREVKALMKGGGW